MPESFVCFGTLTPEFVEEGPPGERNGYVTFGTTNAPYKISQGVVALWARVMREVSDSRFMLVRPECRSMVLCKNLMELLSKVDGAVKSCWPMACLYRSLRFGEEYLPVSALLVDKT